MQTSWKEKKTKLIDALMAKTSFALQAANNGDLDAVEARLFDRNHLLHELHRHDQRATLKDLLGAFAELESWAKQFESISNWDRDIVTSIRTQQMKILVDLKSSQEAKRGVLEEACMTGKGVRLEVQG